MEKVKEFLLTDIRLLNGFVLMLFAVSFLVLVGFASYALTSAKPIETSDIVISIK